MRCYLCDVCDDGRPGLVWTIHLGMHVCQRCHSTHIVTKSDEASPVSEETSSSVTKSKAKTEVKAVVMFPPGHRIPVPGYHGFEMYVGNWTHLRECCWCANLRENKNQAMCNACDRNGLNEEKKVVVREWFKDQGLTT